MEGCKMYSFLRFPGFKKKALTLSYDDGTIYDKRLVSLFDRYGLKSTFNLNSSAYGKGRRLTLEDAVALYKDSPHEIAVHGREHFSLGEIPSAQGAWDILADRRSHEETYGRFVRGMAYANGSCDERVAETAGLCGIAYARTVTSTGGFDIPTEWLKWNPTCHHTHPRFFELVDEFLADKSAANFWQDRPHLFFLWGHSYEFEDGNLWGLIENFSRKVGNRADIWYATNIEICDYVRAYDCLIWSADGKTVYNPTATTIYISPYGQNIKLFPGELRTMENLYF